VELAPGCTNTSPCRLCSSRHFCPSQLKSTRYYCTRTRPRTWAVARASWDIWGFLYRWMPREGGIFRYYI